METIDISGLDKAEVLAELYNRAQTQGLGPLHFDPENMTKEQAAAILDSGSTYFDYLKGRVLKVDLSKEEFNPALYDRDNGENAAARVIEPIARPVCKAPDSRQYRTSKPARWPAPSKRCAPD